MADFTINKEYAKKYDTWRRKEELQKLKSKFGDDYEEELEDNSSSESEDENAEALTAQMEKDWLRTVAAVISKDPRIYQKDYTFYHNSSSSVKNLKNKDKPMFLKDYERKVIVERDGMWSDTDGSDSDDRLVTSKPGYYEEQEEIKKSLKLAVDEIEEDDETELLTKRTKTKEQEEKEQADYVAWLKGQKDDLEADDLKAIAPDLEPLRSYWSREDLTASQRFLRDYILNKEYLQLEDNDYIPTYDEIVRQEEEIEEEEEQLKKEEQFELKYNFRYEDPDQVFIKNYPRTIGDSLRKKNTKRIDKRNKLEERKEKEKQKKKEDLIHMKKMKREEVMERIQKIQQVTGMTQLPFDIEEFNQDFDPEKHDQVMQAVFSGDYYDQDQDLTKPTFEQDDDWMISEGGDDEEENLPDCERSDFNMDADFEDAPPPLPSALVKAVKQNKPEFNSGEMTFDEYFNEYYKLDYEDLIGDLPCRFKYRQVPANNFGLSVDEILTCPDQELNQWVSIKRMSQHRSEEDERFDKKRFKKKALKKKFKVLPSLLKTPEELTTATTIAELTKKKKKKKRNRLEEHENSKLQETLMVEEKLNTTEDEDTWFKVEKGENEEKNKKKGHDKKNKQTNQQKKIHKEPVKKKRKMEVNTDKKEKIMKVNADSERKTDQTEKKIKRKKGYRDAALEIPDARLRAYGLNPEKTKKLINQMNNAKQQQRKDKIKQKRKQQRLKKKHQQSD